METKRTKKLENKLTECIFNLLDEPCTPELIDGDFEFLPQLIDKFEFLPQFIDDKFEFLPQFIDDKFEVAPEFVNKVRVFVRVNKEPIDDKFEFLPQFTNKKPEDKIWSQRAELARTLYRNYAMAACHMVGGDDDTFKDEYKDEKPARKSYD